MARSAACTARRVTRAQQPWGKNDRAQDGAGGFIDDRQPTHPASIGQPDLLGRIELPDLMRLRRARQRRLARRP
jgi:hypothetical protein